MRALAADSLRVGAWVAHKEYALMTLVVDWWMEPLGPQPKMRRPCEFRLCLSEHNALAFALVAIW